MQKWLNSRTKQFFNRAKNRGSNFNFANADLKVYNLYCLYFWEF